MKEKTIKSVAIFCGSSKGNNPVYEKVSSEYAALLAKDGIKIVYGGGSTGIMGVVAETALQHSGYVIGVAPGFLNEKEVVHQGLQELHIVKDMFERKALLLEISDAFAILPGGIGTMDEFFEVFTALQLETIQKPIGILNVNGYYDMLIGMIERMVQDQFFRKEHFNDLIINSDPLSFHSQLISHQPKKVYSWVNELRKNNKF
jgi:uncharacterized protein (TIGR00730 family)